MTRICTRAAIVVPVWFISRPGEYRRLSGLSVRIGEIRDQLEQLQRILEKIE